jgi:hypothetical protein
VRRISRGIPFSAIIYWLEKGLNSCQVDVLLDQFNECEGTRSLDDLFIFRESEKSLTMDSGGVPFS